MCQTQAAIYAPCGRTHITAKCRNKSCSTRRHQKELGKRRQRGVLRCDACYGCSVPMQMWHMVRDGVTWPLRRVRILRSLMRKIERWFCMALYYLIIAIRWMSNYVLRVPQGSRGRWWLRANEKRLEIMLHSLAFIIVLFFTLHCLGLAGQSKPWYSGAFWTITSQTSWTWNPVIGSRRNVVMRLLHWIWNHTLAAVKAVVQMLIGVFNWIGLTWCEMNCSFFAGDGWSGSVKVKGCKWECFNKL